MISLLIFMGDGYAAVETADNEELRNRARQEAQDREKQLKSPNVNLQGEIPEAGFSPQLPAAETPCFTVNSFVLEVPGTLSPAARRYGASKLPMDTFRFARDFLEQYKGECIGREGINT